MEKGGASVLSFSIENILKGAVSQEKEENDCERRTKSPVSSDAGSFISSDSENTPPCDETSSMVKKPRTTFHPRQLRSLEETYHIRRYVPATERKRLAEILQLTDIQVKTWFQNRRMKDRRMRPNLSAFPLRAFSHQLHPLGPSTMQGQAPQTTFYPNPVSIAYNGFSHLNAQWRM